MSDSPGSDGAELDAAGLRIGVALASYNPEITDGLLDGALAVLSQARVTVARVAGSFELPLLAEGLIEAGHDAVVALGAVIEGETDHYEHIARETARGLQDVMLATGAPVTFGVLTVRDIEHAKKRSSPGPNNKGREAAEAAVRAVLALREVAAPSSTQ